MVLNCMNALNIGTNSNWQPCLDPRRLPRFRLCGRKHLTHCRFWSYLKSFREMATKFIMAGLSQLLIELPRILKSYCHSAWCGNYPQERLKELRNYAIDVHSKVAVFGDVQNCVTTGTDFTAEWFL